MKLLLISYTYNPPYFGGGLTRMIKTLKSLKARGHQVNVLTSGVPGYTVKENIAGIIIQRSPIVGTTKIAKGFRRLIFPLWSRSKLYECKPDIIHVEELGGITPVAESLASWLLTSAAKNEGGVTIKQHTLADTEEDMFSVNGFKNRLRLHAWEKFDAVVSVSPALHKAVSQYLPQKSYCIMNGVDTDVYSPMEETTRAQFRKNSGIDDGEVIFTFLGSIGYRKGFDLLANAFLELSRKHPNWHLWVIGPSKKEENQNINEEEVTELRSILATCDRQVKYWGRIDDEEEIAKILGASDIFVFPSRREGFPNAPLEAMACGVPPIIARIPGVTDLANLENITGLYCKVGDLASLKEKMIVLGTDQELRKKMGSAAHQRILAEFNWKKYICNWEQLYNQLITINH